MDRKYPCPECKTGELYDSNAGGMFGAIIKCNNPNCKHENHDDLIGCVSSDIDD